MTAALIAHDRGGSALLIEKSELYGGNSAMSGGGLWVPCNHLMPPTGIDDSPEEALGYMKTITRGAVEEDRLRVYVDTAAELVKYLEDNARLEWQSLPEYADYYPETPGGKPGARSIEPQNLDASLLGEEFELMREPALQELIMARISMTVLQARVLMCKTPGWKGLTARLMAGYWFDIGWRMRTKRDRRLALGNALIGRLRLSLMDRGVPLWLNTAARELITEEGRVVGIVAEKEGRTIRIRADKGVVLASGGFEASDELRKKYLPSPTKAEWTCGSTSNTGDAIGMGLAVGATLDLMDDAWWGPVTVVPGEDRARMLVIEKSMPGCIMVDKKGARFVNEAAPYVDVVKGTYEHNSSETQSVPAYMIIDSTYRSKYPFGPLLQASQQPDRRLPKSYTEGYLRKSDTLEGLAEQLGIDAAGLRATIDKMREYARTGKDTDFNRGDSLFDRYYGDAGVTPNACLAPMDKPPYYGIEAFPGDLGTKGGLKTNASAQVVTEAGEPIAGLYAVGNCSASIMGPSYAGAGATIGPAMTFAYIAARHAIAV